MPPKPPKPIVPVQPSATPVRVTAAPLATTPGGRLRQEREARGLAVIDIANTLRIKPVFIEALEADRPEALPTVTHARGFMRSYAQYLGVDLDIVPLGTAAPPLTVPQSGQPVGGGLPHWVASLLPLLLIVIGILGLYLLWQWLQPAPAVPIAPPPQSLLAPVTPVAMPAQPQTVAVPPAAEPEVAAQPAEPQPEPPAAPAPTPAADAAKTLQPSIAAAPAAAQPVVKIDPLTDKVVVRAIADSWVQITDATGRQLYNRLMRAGENWRAPPQAGLHLSTGNAGGLVLVRNGEAGAPLGNHAQVLKNYVLTGTAAAPKPRLQVKPPVTYTAPENDEPPLDTDD